MDHKALKQDLTYALKKMQKDGKVLTAHDDNLIVDKENKSFVGETHFGPLEVLVIMKGFAPTFDHLSTIGYNISLLDLLVENTGIIKNDWYAFLDGFDNIVAGEKNEFYNVGSYLREKFSPQGARAETLKPVSYKEDKPQGEICNLFTIYSFKGKTAVMEVKCEKIIFPLDPPGEYKARVLAPESLFEKKPNGSLVPPLYCWHGLYTSPEEAMVQVESDIRSTFDRAFRKKGVVFTEEEVQAKLKEIQVIKL